jgi:hypothetical protein
MPLQPVAVNDAFRNITIGGTTVSAEQVGDSLTLQAGINIVFTADAGSDTITIDAGAAAGNVSANPDSTNTSRYLIFTAGTSGNQVVYADSDISYNPSTNVLTAGSFSGGLSAANLSGTIPSAVLANSTVYIGTTAIGLDRTSASQTLNGVSIDGNAATATSANSATTAGSATTASNLSGGNNTTLLGSMPYQSNTDTTTLLSPNTTTTKKFLRMTGDGTNGAAPAWDTIAAGDVPTLNQNTTGTASGLSGNQVANYFYAGPTTGPAAPASWRAIVAGDIPTLNQNTSGTAAGLSGTQTANYVYAAPSGSSGTASFRALLALDIPPVTNLAGGNNTTLLGSMPYQSNTDTTTLLSPNTTTTKKFLRMTGDGTNGAAPSWDTVTASDVGLGNVTNESKATMFANPTFTGTVNTAAMSSSSTISDSKGEVRLVPVASQAGSYPLVLTDHGTCIASGAGVTVPSGIFSAGQSVTIYNNTAGNITITQDGGVTMYLVGTATTGNRTLAQRGLATVFCVSANTFVISGGGLT